MTEILVVWQSDQREITKELRRFQLDQKAFEIVGLSREHQVLHDEYVDFINEMRKKIVRVKDQFGAIGRAIKENHSENSLRDAISTFETKLNAVKSSLQASYERGSIIEGDLYTHVSSFNLDGYEDSSSLRKENTEESKNNHALQHVRVTENLDKSLAIHAKVGSIDRRIAELGGRCGGWESRDHDVFLREATKMTSGDLASLRPDSRTVLKKLAMVLPGMSESDIVEHINWHTQYCSLLREKKEVVESWKKQRTGNATDFTPEKIITDVQENFSDKVGVGKLSYRDSSRTREELERWREERRAQRQEEEDARRRKEAQDDALRQEQAHREQLLKKQRIQAWRDKESELAPLAETARSAAAPVDRRVIEQNHQRNVQVATERKQKIDAKLKQSMRRTSILLAKNTLNLAERDPDRLLKETKASETNKVNILDLDRAEKFRSTAGAHASRIPMGAYDLKFKGKAVPTWRKGANLN